MFRDTSAWNHFVISIDTTNSYVRLYQNGAEIATGSISAGTDIKLNDAGTHYIGRYAASSADHFNGYMANIHFIDGQAYGPEYFGKTDTATGAWIAKEYDGTGLSGDTAVTGTTDQKYGSKLTYSSLFNSYIIIFICICIQIRFSISIIDKA